jgi:Asp-tRNA(Asn)/Glu-tRNA(Gln) amidotransferase A subunit family amidase
VHDVPLHELGAADIVRLTHAGTLSAEAVVRACLERIAQREDTVGAWALAFELQTYPNQLSWALRKRIEVR